MTSTDVVLRRAEPGDAEVLVDVHLRARAAAPMPAPVHDAADMRRWMTGRTAPGDAL